MYVKGNHILHYCAADVQFNQLTRKPACRMKVLPSWAAHAWSNNIHSRSELCTCRRLTTVQKPELCRAHSIPGSRWQQVAAATRDKEVVLQHWYHGRQC